MRRIAGPVLVLALALPALGDDNARDKAASAAGTTLAGKRYEALLKQYDEAEQALTNAGRGAQTPLDRQRVGQQLRALSDRFASQFLALATRYPRDPAGVDALTWVLQHSRTMGRSGPRAKAVTLMRRNHIKSDRLGPACLALDPVIDRDSETVLRSVLSANPHTDVQGVACLALAEVVSKRAEMAPPRTAPKLQRDSEKLFDRAVRQYADVRLPSGGTVGDAANKELFALQHLSVGRTAMDIEGEDQDGKKFKLSDYRGKVVLLDFWGNW
jgi:hypothetical protein